MFLRIIRPVIVSLAFFSLLTGVLYPLAVTGIARILFSKKANGSLIEEDGRIIGSELIGQPFSDPKYFWGRLSATSPFPYNSASSSGSNYGPLNPAFRRADRDRIDSLHASDPLNRLPLPVDLVTASGSGLDPHITLAGALFQVPRVARARRVSETLVRTLVSRFVQPRALGFLGEPGVNVLELNLALDHLSSNDGR